MTVSIIKHIAPNAVSLRISMIDFFTLKNGRFKPIQRTGSAETLRAVGALSLLNVRSTNRIHSRQV